MTLRKAIRLNPDYLPARVKLGESLLGSGEWEKSHKVYQGVLKENPGVALAHYGLGRIHSARGKSSLAAESYRKACRLAPGFGAAHYALALAYRDLGETARAKEQLSLFRRNKEAQAPLNDPLMREVAALKSGVSYHLRQGYTLQGAGRFREALGEFQKALKLNPDYTETHVHLLSAYLELKEFKKAEKHYQAAVKLAPDTYDAHYNYAMVMIQQGRQQEAIDAFQKVLQIDPHHADSHKNLGLLFLDQGKQTEAEKHFRLAIENRPHFAVPHFALGRILQSRGKTQEAIDHFQKALTLEDQNASLFLYFLAGAYARAGNREKAIHYARQAKQQSVSLSPPMKRTIVPEIEKLLTELERSSQPR